MCNITDEEFPVLEHIHLHTNGQLWNERNWNKLSHLHSKIKSAEISMALIEACINAFEHSESNNQVEINFKIKDSLLEIQVSDKGIGFDKSKVSIPKIEEKLNSDYKRGWGLKLIEELMDTVKFESTGEGTTVTMTKKK